MKEGTHLTGLEGNNPLGFLAALGVQVLYDFEEQQPKLWWTDDVIPHAVVDSAFDIDRIVEQAFEVFPQWLESPALNPGFGAKADDTAKFNPTDLQKYLAQTRSHQPGNRLAAALVAEGSLDGAGKVAKPTDLYFAAGQLKFLKIARTILAEVEREAVFEALEGPWSYTSSISSLGWDVTDDRIYAIAPTNPAKEKKMSNPGAEALAVLGLSRHPVFTSRDQRGRHRTLTVGCSGPWRRNGAYTWPLWSRPSGPKAVDSLLAHATGNTTKQLRDRGPWYRSWGITQVTKSAIRRSSQGGYGTFGPPEIIWP